MLLMAVSIRSHLYSWSQDTHYYFNKRMNVAPLAIRYHVEPASCPGTRD